MLFSSIFILSSIFNPLPVSTQVKPKLVTTVIVEPSGPMSMRDRIVQEFGTSSPMVDIVKCESRFRQFNEKGKPLMSPTSDVGIMQINQANWKQAKKLGLDIFNSVDDNIKMGRYILKTQGLKAWTCYSQDDS